MAEYTLTAQYSWEPNTLTTATETFEAISDIVANRIAMDLVLDYAHANPNGLWSKGKITLTDSTGKILQEMPAK
jgi:hypothetical protein